MIEDGVVFDKNSLIKDETIGVFPVLCLNFLKDEKLILLLLIHHKILSTDDGKPFFALRDIHTNDLVGLSTY